MAWLLAIEGMEDEEPVAHKLAGPWCDDPGVVGDNESLGCRGSVVGQDTAARYYRGRPAAALKKLIRFAARYYRERPAAALKKRIKFYVSMGHPASLRAKH